MKNLLLGLLISLAFIAGGCAELAGLSALSPSTVSTGGALSTTEIVAGLKEALTVGTNKATGKLSGLNGYYADAAVKILLPSEAQVITKNLSKLPGGSALVESVVKNINAAASDAAKEAAPIFVNAIKDMSIVDGAKILTGGNTAATNYFKSKTRTQLKALFGKKIDASLQKKIVGDVSAATSWNTLTTEWNGVANSMVGRVTGLTTVNTDLNDYLTDKAMEGLFLKIGEQETEIRTKASARTTTLLKRVFGR